jgi:type I site-specific restriction endonuclease
LVEEINNLNETLRKKNDEINFLTTCDRRQLEDHENSENSLKLLVGRLEDKIFTIQRENELELYDTIARLKSQYEENLTKAQAEWDDIRLAHNATVDALRREIGEQKKEIHLLGSENIALEGQHKQLAAEQQHSVQMLSQKIISMETERDNELKNYTTSMKQIEDDAKAKLDDLHTAIQNKNTRSPSRTEKSPICSRRSADFGTATGRRCANWKLPTPLSRTPSTTRSQPLRSRCSNSSATSTNPKTHCPTARQSISCSRSC